MLVVLALTLSSTASAFFVFGQQQYIAPPFTWTGGDVTIDLPVQLQSCNGTSVGSGFLSCGWFKQLETYTIEASDFDFIASGSASSIAMSKVTFQQGVNSLLIKDGGTVPDTSATFLNPGNWQQVTGNVSVKINALDLQGQPPGNYQAVLKLKGMESGGWIPYTDNSDLIFDLKIPDRIQVSGLKDIALNDQALQGSMDFCVYTQSGSNFTVRATGLDTDFLLSGQVGYQLRVGQGGIMETLSPGVDGQPWSGSTQQYCDGASNMNLEVTVPSSEISGLLPGVYKDTVTVTVSVH
ncbi:hypothetical protein GZ78_05315 [Endozoicomonas numazuensis]|uniref:Spore coat protein U domain-containing protein n=2 Tax=Endozoicomonas numazuensis TaxID=1137799 RepID=A0A081NLQ7_9GAMM|nr:hypothetical protein GZ78_05315 [Endozoicomonas numazuensis]